LGLDDVRAVLTLVAAEEKIAAFVTVEGSALPGKGADNQEGLLEEAGCDEAVANVGMARPKAAHDSRMMIGLDIYPEFRCGEIR
jgi:inosine-uridine nucleoside N-ribohydrolase